MCIALVYTSYLINSWALGRPRLIPFNSLTPFLLNVVLTSQAILFLYALTNRVYVAALLTTLLLIFWTTANLLKYQYLSAVIQPLDLIYWREFLAYAHEYISWKVCLLLIAIAGVAILLGIRCWQSSRRRLPVMARMLAGLTAIVVTAVTVWSLRHPEHVTTWEKLGMTRIHWSSAYSALVNGMVLDFAMEVPDSFLFAPAGYSKEAVARIESKYQLSPLQDVAITSEPIDLVVYFMESLIDPQMLGYPYTADPVPNLRRLWREHSSGHVYVPHRHQGSGNTEFEFFTGMSHFFLPDRASPYKQFVKRPIPSLPQLLKTHGYSTHSFHADSVWMYSRQQAYPLLGIETLTSYYGDRTQPKDPAGRYVSDAVLTQSVLNKLREGSGPKFIFTFPNSSHGPYDYPAYSNSPLAPTAEVPSEISNELKVYLNAIHAADRTFNDMLEEISKMNRKVIVVALGDHWPPLSWNHQADRKIDTTDLEKWNAAHRTPFLIWSNFPRRKRDHEVSANFLPTIVLKELGIKPPGLFALGERVAEQAPILSSYIRTSDGQAHAREKPPANLIPLIEDYRMLQYDLLRGEQYSVPSPAGKLPQWPSG